MEWLSGLHLLTVPQWFQNISTAAVGALIAYTAWSWLHSPYLYPQPVEHKDVVEVDNEKTQQSIRIPIENVGTRAAENCEAVIQLRVETDGDVVRSFYPVPWLPTRAELVVDDSEQSSRTTIPAARSQAVELVRQERTGSTQIYPKLGGNKFIRTSPDDEYHQPVDSSVEYAVLAPSGTRESDAVRTTGRLLKEDIIAGDWKNAVIELTVETESARPLVVRFDAEADDEGDLTVTRQALPWQRRLIGKLYRTLNRIRGLSD